MPYISTNLHKLEFYKNKTSYVALNLISFLPGTVTKGINVIKFINKHKFTNKSHVCPTYSVEKFDYSVTEVYITI